jgi:oligopeptidase B
MIDMAYPAAYILGYRNRLTSIGGNMMQRFVRAATLIVLVLAAAGSVCSQRAPVAGIKAQADTILGKVLEDNYGWLRDDTRSDPEVIAYLDEENAYTKAMMGHTEGLRQTLYDEMVARIKETDQSVPVKRDDYYYYTRTEKGRQYDIYCRRHGSLESPEEIILDVNSLAEGHDFMDVGSFEVSPDHRTLAFAVDSIGNERYALCFMDIESGRLYPETIDSVSTSVAWANDNLTVFYARTDEAWRASRAFRHELGSAETGDAMVYYEPDERFDIEISKSKNMDYIFLASLSETSTEYRFIDADRPLGELRVVDPRRDDVEYHVYAHDDSFYIVTNDEAVDFRLVRAPIAAPSRTNWIEVIGARDSVTLDRLDVFEDFIVLYEREQGLRQISVRDLAAGTTTRIEFPEPVYVIYPAENPEYTSAWLRFTYESLVTPESVYDFNMRTHERVLKKQQEVRGYVPEDYESERIFVAAGGTAVPVSLVWKKGPAEPGPRPLYLYGYGAYGLSSNPYFSSSRVSLLDRGFIFAIAHVRGGGELGRRWYYDGRLLNKKNTFTDFIAVADYLVANRYTTRDRLVISGVSAGGLLIGATLNMAPNLCAIAVADVPFVDIMNTMLDETLPLTVTEYEEWGNPNEPEYFAYMLSYSPYDNVAARRYPDMLVTASLYDTRVGYWEPAKWVAKLRALKTDPNLILLKTDMGAGHGGAPGRYGALEEIAFEYAFLIDRLGLGN